MKEDNRIKKSNYEAFEIKIEELKKSKGIRDEAEGHLEELARFGDQ